MEQTIINQLHGIVSHVCKNVFIQLSVSLISKQVLVITIR